jgi:hypothetical protein
VIFNHDDAKIAEIHHTFSSYLKMAPYRNGGAAKDARLLATNVDADFVYRPNETNANEDRDESTAPTVLIFNVCSISSVNSSLDQL